MELDNRKEKILKSLIDEYIETADPVSSAGLISKYPLNISSATVRNGIFGKALFFFRKGTIKTWL